MPPADRVYPILEAVALETILKGRADGDRAGGIGGGMERTHVRLGDEMKDASAPDVRVQRRRAVTPWWCRMLACICAGLVLGMALVVLGAQVLAQDWMARQASGFKGTHPATAIMLVLLAGSFLVPRTTRYLRIIAYGLAAGALVLAVARFVPAMSGLYIRADGVATGLNTAATLGILALGRIAMVAGRYAIGQFMALVATSILMAAFVGNIFDQAGLYGKMSDMTLFLGWLLVGAALLGHAGRGVVADLSGVCETGFRARLDLAVGLLGPVLIAIGMIYFAGFSGAHEALAVLVAQIIGLNLLTIALNARFARRLDLRRRHSEEERYWAVISDEVTGLYNRSALKARFEEMTKDPHLSSRGLSVIVLDVDGFGAVNQMAGFEGGDEILRRIGAELLGHLGGDDILARPHSDEFVALLPDCRTRKATTIARDMCHAVAQMDIGTAQGVLTVSAGIARWHMSETGPQFYNRARAAVEIAQLRGGNQACMAPHPGGVTPVWTAVQEVPVTSYGDPSLSGRAV
ncbi:GGDEF domain-containing protein [Rhodobacteraceae bacterium]|nr:GGDEF domain-containing protein [Paracoccaceae bacterium]